MVVNIKNDIEMKKILLIVMALVALTSCGSKKDEVALVQQIDEQKLEQEASDYAFNEFVVKYKFLQEVYLAYKKKGFTSKDFRSCFGAELFEINMNNYDLEKAFVTDSDEFLDAMTTKYKCQYKKHVMEYVYEQNLKIINAVDKIDPNTPEDKKVTIKF